MTYHLNGLGAGADCAQLAAAAKESTRIAQTMVRFNQMGGGDEKTRGIANLLRDWSTGTGESYEAMEARWRAKSNADGATAAAATAAAAEASRVYETILRTRKLGGSPAKTTQITALMRSWSLPGEDYAAMEARRRTKSNTDAATALAARNAAAESNRVYQTMVSTRQMSGGDEKTRKIAQLRASWATSTGEGWPAMMARWGVKRAADVKAASDCASGATPAESAGAPVPGASDPSAPAPGAPGPGAAAEESAGLPMWAWGAMGVGAIALIGGALVVRRMKNKKAAAPALPK